MSIYEYLDLWFLGVVEMEAYPPSKLRGGSLGLLGGHD